MMTAALYIFDPQGIRDKQKSVESIAIFNRLCYPSHHIGGSYEKMVDLGNSTRGPACIWNI